MVDDLKRLGAILRRGELRSSVRDLSGRTGNLGRSEGKLTWGEESEGGVFLLESVGVWERSSSLVALLSREEIDEEALENLAALAGSIRYCKEVTIVSNDDPELEWQPSGEDVCVKSSSARDFFEKIFSIPATMASQLQDVARVERAGAFPNVYQERRARVLIPSDQRGQSEVDADSYFQQWLRTPTRSSPILLLGERGTGKSWQLLHLSQSASRGHRRDPLAVGPAFFVSLRELVNSIETSGAGTPLLSQYIFDHYDLPDSVLPRISVLGAVLGAGHSVVCLDGFDEMDQLPSDAEVQARLTMLLLVLSKQTKFIMSCRSGHFASLASLLELHAWSSLTVGEAFEIIELLPFGRGARERYLAKAGCQSELVGRWVKGDVPSIPAGGETGFEDAGYRESVLGRAVWTSARHPGLCAHIVEMGDAGVENPLELLASAVVKILIQYNVIEGRTRETYRTSTSKKVDLTIGRRIELLGELAWYMAERRLEVLDLANLPPRLIRTYQLEGEALERDLRSQTTFEIVSVEEEPRATENGRSTHQEGAAAEERTSLVRFALRDPDQESPDVDSSVTGAYFLASYIRKRLLSEGPLGGAPVEHRLRPLGRFQLGDLSAAILAQMFESEFGRGFVSGLAREAALLLRRIAQEGCFRVFSPRFKYLARNLWKMGGWSLEFAREASPWRSDDLARLTSVGGLPAYELVLVPCGGKASSVPDPFLLGVHEVCNADYLHFLRSRTDLAPDPTIQPREWSVERITAAGSGLRTPPSPNRVLTNEYHLFYWLPQEHRGHKGGSADLGRDGELRYLPQRGQEEYPVTYVSWYAAAAFCDWLSLQERLGRGFYRAELREGLKSSGEGLPHSTGESNPTAYRLPTEAEWIWAAQGGHADIERPWQMFPYFLSSEQRRTVQQKAAQGSRAAIEYLGLQEDMRNVLLHRSKTANAVLYDEFNDFGVSGMMGNVREWCEGSTSSQDVEIQEQKVILGATGYLGETTFDYGYRTSLYPRNTNPDVGFRLARSLTIKELRELREIEAAVASVDFQKQS